MKLFQIYFPTSQVLKYKAHSPLSTIPLLNSIQPLMVFIPDNQIPKEKVKTENKLTICTLSPCIAVAARPFMHNHCSNASTPLFVSTKTRVKAYCTTSYSISENQPTENFS